MGGLRPLDRSGKVSKPRPVNEHEKGKLRREKEKADYKRRNRR
jgi:hypothetical protein